MALYQGGAFLDFSLDVPKEPLTLADIQDLSIIGVFANNNSSTTAPTPCLAILQGQDTGYLVTPSPQSPGFAFLPSNGMCPCESCIKITRCCGDILNADGTTLAKCYTPVLCNKPGACLRNFQCLGLQSSAPTIQPGNVASFVAPPTTNALPTAPCFKFSPAPAGTNGFAVNRVNQGFGFTVQQCAAGTACLAVVPCCATLKKPCLSVTPCCVPLGEDQSKDCLSVQRCDTPINPTGAVTNVP